MSGTGLTARSFVLILSVLYLGAPTHAAELLRGGKIAGGLCVVLGSDGALPAAELAEGKPFIVHCLMSEQAHVRTARKTLFDKKLYGRVSVEYLPKRFLPYADNLVSMIVVAGPCAVRREEMLRVLRPYGELLVRHEGKWRRIVKPRPAGMDDWTHWRHGPDRNAVSKDTLVDVSRRIQWLFTPREVTERAHVVLANGRYFAQNRGMLIARDAFNGLGLWKARLKHGKDFHWEYRVKLAAQIVAAGERVYCLAEDNRFKALDAATGRCVKVYDSAGVPYVVLLVGGTLVLAGSDSIRALDADSGKLLWKHSADRPGNVIACDYGAFYIEGSDRRGASSGRITGRDLATGKLVWQKDYYWARRTELGAFGYDRIVYELRVPHKWRQFYATRREEQQRDRRYQMVVISARTGGEIQKIMRTGSSARHGEFRRAFWYRNHLMTEAIRRGNLNLALFALDDMSKPAEVFRANYAGDRGFGHCYPPVLTPRFYINGQLHFTDLKTRKQISNQITRGSCNTSRAGYIPANGMLYTFPKHCLCFPMLEGNVALASAYKDEPKETHELVKGPAYAEASNPKSARSTSSRQAIRNPQSEAWPTFRRDSYRSGGSDTAVPAELDVIWTARIAGPDYAKMPAAEWIDSPYTAGSITAPVIADGLVYVAQSDTHRLIALDAGTGRQKWQFVANGRLDGPPTIYRGLCLIGCRSGWIFCLRASDGELVWKLRAAPYERRICTYGQVSSPWPVHGSILIADSLAYAAAGVHPNADGGIRVLCFKPETGRIVWKGVFDDLGFDEPWPAPHEPRTKRPESNPWRTIRPMGYRYGDLPVRDGDSVAISRCLFDLKTERPRNTVIGCRSRKDPYRHAVRGKRTEVPLTR